MHEMSLMEALLHTAEDVLSAYEVKSVNSLTVSAGPLANIMPDAFAFAYEVLTKDTVMEGAELIVNKLPVQARCCECGHEYSGDHIPGECPCCGKQSMRITGGSEVYLTGIDFEEAGADEDRR
ncbi:MAG: hydrogenase maturation nickel metallochaperone HypA [Firmicutes bacterium]|nr:hydrogenase maturation nickel metallochaperone HypA [Bacillota bacterium]